MLSDKPIKIEKVGRQATDAEILRLAIVAELDAINLYDQLAASTDNVDMKKVLLDIAKEEKTEFKPEVCGLDEFMREATKELDLILAKELS